MQNRTEQNFIHVGKHVGSLTGDIRYIKNIQKKEKDIDFLSHKCTRFGSDKLNL